MSTDASPVIAKNVFRLGAVLIAYTIAENLWYIGDFDGPKGLALYGALVCFVGIGIDLLRLLPDDLSE